MKTAHGPVNVRENQKAHGIASERVLSPVRRKCRCEVAYATEWRSYLFCLDLQVSEKPPDIWAARPSDLSLAKFLFMLRFKVIARTIGIRMRERESHLMSNETGKRAATFPT